MVHVVVCSKRLKELDNILKGDKTALAKATKYYQTPCGRLAVNETVYFMEKGTRKITAKATISNVVYYAAKKPILCRGLLMKYSERLMLTAETTRKYYNKHLNIVEIKDAQAIEPLDFSDIIEDRGDDWYVAEKIEHLLQGTKRWYYYPRGYIVGDTDWED